MKKQVAFLMASMMTLSTFSFCASAKSIDLEQAKLNEAQKWEKVDELCRSKNGSGTYSKNDKGSILVTKDPSSSSFYTGHAAIMYDTQYIVESTPDDRGVVGVSSGVHKSPNNWDSTSVCKTCYQAIPYTSGSNRASAADYCYRQIGKSYIMPHLPPAIGGYRDIRNKFYCSHLVWAGYYDDAHYDLAPGAKLYVSPVDLLNSNYTNISYYRD